MKSTRNNKTNVKMELTTAHKETIFGKLKALVAKLITTLAVMDCVYNWAQLTYLVAEEFYTYIPGEGGFEKMKNETRKNDNTKTNNSRGVPLLVESKTSATIEKSVITLKNHVFDLSQVSWVKDLYSKTKAPYAGFINYFMYCVTFAYRFRSMYFNTKLDFGSRRVPGDLRIYFPMAGLPKHVRNLKWKESGIGYALIEASKIDPSSKKSGDKKASDKWERLMKHAMSLCSHSTQKKFILHHLRAKKTMNEDAVILLLRSCHFQKPKRNNKFYPSLKSCSPCGAEKPYRNIAKNFCGSSSNTMEQHQAEFHAIFGTEATCFNLLEAISTGKFTERSSWDFIKPSSTPCEIKIKPTWQNLLAPSKGSAQGEGSESTSSFLTDFPAFRIGCKGYHHWDGLKAAMDRTNTNSDEVTEDVVYNDLKQLIEKRQENKDISYYSGIAETLNYEPNGISYFSTTSAKVGTDNTIQKETILVNMELISFHKTNVMDT